MSERPGPPIEALGEFKERGTELTPKERKDLAVLWERLGSGQPLDVTGSNDQIVDRIWWDSKAGFEKDVLPKLKIEFDEEAWEKRNNSESLEERAALEESFLKVAQDTLRKSALNKAGWGSTPGLSKQNEWRTDCVGVSTAMGISLQKRGLDVRAARMPGHFALSVGLANGERLLVDVGGGAFGRLPPTGEPLGPRYSLIKLDSKQRRNLKTSTGIIVEQPLGEAFLDSALGNLDVLRAQKLSDMSKEDPGWRQWKREITTLFRKNRSTLIRQRHWYDIMQKLLPEQDRRRKTIEQIEKADAPRRDALALLQDIMQIIVRDKKYSTEIISSLLDGAQPHREQIVSFFETNGDFPNEAPEPLRAFALNLREAIHTVPEAQRQFMYAEISDRLHEHQRA